MIWVFFLVVAVGLVAVFAALLTGRMRYDPLADPVTSQNDPGLPEAPHARDVDGVRFDRALRGYRMDQVDDVLDSLRDTLRRQEETIAVLRRGETGPDAEAADTAYRPDRTATELQADATAPAGSEAGPQPERAE